jgi:hypothetical protein
MLLDGCVNRAGQKSPREKMQGFLEELLLEHGGAYTLFGSKAVTMENLLDYSPEDIVALREYFQQHPKVDYVLVDRQLEEGWEAWKNQAMPVSKKYVLAEVIFPCSHMLVFVNIPNTIDVMNRHRGEFEEILGKGFEVQEIIEELQAGTYSKWVKLLSDPLTSGILLGYGTENARLFRDNLRNGAVVTEIMPSENNDPRLKAECTLNGRPFRLPIFGIYDQSASQRLLAQYKKERSTIQKYYSHKDFFDVTMKQFKEPKKIE